MENLSPLVAFSAGLLSFLSPCILPLVPVYLATLSGSEVFDARAVKRRAPVFLHSLSFVFGFSIVFVILGAGAGLAGFVISSHLTVIRKIVGSLLIIFGLFPIAALKVPWLNYERRLTPSLGATTGYLRSFLIGAIFPVAWVPCTSWVLGGILMLAGTSETAWHGAYLLAIYSLGLGLPFLAMGVAFDVISPLLRKINRYAGIVYIAGGIMLIAVGILILTNRLVWL